MGLSNALFSSVTGLDATSTAISVVGDNIANVNTPGFKERRAEFSDVLGQTISSVGGFSQVGAGVKTARISTIFSQGTFENTGRPTDLAIEGRGFFVVDTPAGSRSFTRAGIFGFDKNGFLSTPDGLRLQGYSIDQATGSVSGTLSAIQLNSAVSPPSQTANYQLSVNLDAQDTDLGGFSLSTPDTTSNFRTVATVYDSLGNPHAATTFFEKTATDNVWNYYVGIDPAETDTAVATAGDLFVQVDSGVLTFDTNGILIGVNPASAAALIDGSESHSITFPFNGGADPTQVIGLNFGPFASGGSGDATTQFGGAGSTVNTFSQDGFGPGTLQSVSIRLDGVLSGQFSNGANINVAQLGLAVFPNLEGLVSIGSNRSIESDVSGQPLYGGPTTGNFGSVRSSTLEQSNVDLASQFVRMIINQRAFQANTRVVSVTNELMGNLVGLGG
ncbi:MAG: flagellar hook protein FlgE [Myxococcales bacterium]|nr:flagellar hook protein FlgE [Myxococcales bacterium]